MRYAFASGNLGGPLRTACVSLSLAVVTACTSIPSTSPASKPVDSAPSEALPRAENVPVVRQGRYTLVELIAEPAQRDLLRQVVDISIPPTLDASVGDALQYVLLHSGYRLCNT